MSNKTYAATYQSSAILITDNGARTGAIVSVILKETGGGATTPVTRSFATVVGA